MRPFDYACPETLEEAFTLLRQDTHNTQVLAGGTDLLPLMKADITRPERLINIKRLATIPRHINVTAQGVTLGALTTLAAIETNEWLQRRYGLLAEAAAVAATPQLRNMATLGGNLLQRPRCWYFRNPHVNCWLKGGDTCPAEAGENQLHAVLGGGPCYAVHPSDLAPALLALQADVRLRGPAGERDVPLADFFMLPAAERRQEVIKEQQELLVSVHLPSLPEGVRSLYVKAMDRKAWAFALVGVAAIMRLEARRIAEVRLVLSGVAPIPWRATASEQALIGTEISTEGAEQAAEQALAGAVPLRHNAYKIPLAKQLIRRALLTLGDTATGHQASG